MTSRKRPHPGRPEADGVHPTEQMLVSNSASSRSPLSEEEQEVFKKPQADVEEATHSPGIDTPPFIKRTLAFLLVVGFGLLGFVILLQTIQAVGTLLLWTPWLAWPLLALISILIGYVIVRLCVVLVRLRKLPRIYCERPADPRNRTTAECLALRDQLVKHLNIIADQKLAASSTLANEAHVLIETANEMPFTAWLQDYIQKIQTPLADAAKRDVRQIALAAGVSAAFSPWRLLDTLIAFNASIEAAQCTLRRFGLRPDNTTTMAFAFDTFLATFFAAAVDEITEDLAKDLQERIGGEFAGNAVGYLGPILTQGIGIAYFVRRLGRRMIHRLETVKLSGF